ncbi:MAG: L-threonylcarbamoyladenylate synthase [Betaproteobacteria bacterium]
MTEPAAIEGAARILAEGGLVAFPTETVYGLGARADDDAVVARIYAAKGRPRDHPLIVHVLDEAGAAAFAGELPGVARKLIQAFWPGPVTVIVPRRPGVAAACAGGQASIGLRCPSHPVARALLQRALEMGVPGVAAPSANRFGRVSPTRAEHVYGEFGPDLLVIDGGACEAGIESAIVDCTRGRPVLLRPGTVDRGALEQACGQALGERDAAAPRASGTLASHYAPAARVRLVSAAHWPTAVPVPLALYSKACPGGAAYANVVWRAMPAGPQAVAHELFAVLRDLDAALAEQGGGEIWVEEPPQGAEWDGVRDRLSRAAA